MTSFNAKNGMKPARTRAYMKLPADRAERAALTRATCPACGRRGVNAATIRGARLWCCTWCNHQWPVPA